MGVNMLPFTSQQMIAVPMLEQGKRININVFHKMLGHPGEDTTRQADCSILWLGVNWKV
jgi:hypothetical protein